MAVHCPECGFVNALGSNYCQKCGAFLAASEANHDPTTMTYRIDDTGEIETIKLDDVVAGSAALVIRAGGGRSGESFKIDQDRMSIGRRPESDIFLDDVTVSRDHALVVKRGKDLYIDDGGSLNGTYVNRKRIESHHLEDGDELQIGKYRLVYLSQE